MLLLWLYRRWQRRRAERAAAAGITTESAAPMRVARQRSSGNSGALGLVLHQARYELIGFLRNGQARFFTLVLPLLFLVIFVSVFGNDTIRHTNIKTSTYYIPGISALAVIAASFVNLVISITTERESGVLKRRRAAPVPAWVLIAGRALTAMTVSLVVMTVVMVIGKLAYGVNINVQAIPAIAVTAIIASGTFCVLGYAVSTAVASADAAQPVVQAIMLPLYFISGVFIPNVNLPTWMMHVAQFFPVQHLASALHTAFDPSVHGAGFSGNDIASLLIWGAVGLVVALRRFSWLPATATAAA
jgi:ABC-2 type transport system permease protein